MTREQIFGRLIAIANVLAQRVYPKGKPLPQSYLTDIVKQPAKRLFLIHKDLMDYTHKFDEHELILLDMFGELMSQLDVESFSDTPLENNFLIHYYSHHHDLSDIVGVAEAAEILDMDKRHIATYIKRGTFPEPLKRLASGPIWRTQQILDYRNARDARK